MAFGLTSSTNMHAVAPVGDVAALATEVAVELAAASGSRAGFPLPYLRRKLMEAFLSNEDPVP